MTVGVQALSSLFPERYGKGFAEESEREDLR